VIYGKRDPGQHGTEPPAICGTWYEWPFQVAYNVSRNKVNDTGADTTGGFIPLENAYAKMLAINNQNTHMYTWDINFHKSLITSQISAQGPTLPTPDARIVRFQFDQYPHNGNYSVSGSYRTILPSSTNPSTNWYKIIITACTNQPDFP